MLLLSFYFVFTVYTQEIQDFENPNQEWFSSRAYFNQDSKGPVKVSLNEKYDMTCLTVEEIFKLCRL